MIRKKVKNTKNRSIALRYPETVSDLKRELFYRDTRNALWKELSMLKPESENEYFFIYYNLIHDILKPIRFHFFALKNKIMTNILDYSYFLVRPKNKIANFEMSDSRRELIENKGYIFLEKNINSFLDKSNFKDEFKNEVKLFFKLNKSKAFLIIPFKVNNKFEGLIILEWIEKVKLTESDIYNCLEFTKILSVTVENYRTQIELKKSEETAMALLNSKNDWALLIDTKGHIIAVNDIVSERLGISKDKLIGQDVFKFFPIELIKSRKKIAELMMTLKQPISFEEVHKVSSYYITICPVLDRHNHIIRLAIHAHDVTDYRRAVQLIFDNEEKFRTLIENSNDVILIVDQNGIIKFSSTTVTQIMGYEINELLGRSIYEYICSEDIEFVASEMYKAYLDPSYKRNIEFKAMHKNKGVRYLEAIANNVLNNPVVGGFVINFRDITDKKLAEIDLNRYKHIVSSSSDHMIFIDNEYKILAANKAFLNDFCKDIEQVKDKKLYEIFGKNEFNSLLVNRCEMVKLGGQAKIECWIDIPKSGKRFMEISFYPYAEDNGKITGIVINLRDNTEKYNMEKDIIEVQENEQKRIGMELHDGLNHSLLNVAIMSKVLGVELEKRDLKGDAEKAFQIEKLANKCIEESRSIAKGLFPVQLEKKSLKEVIEKIISSFKERSNVETILNYNKGLPEYINIKALTHIYYILNEALINVSKHANASKVIINCYCKDSTVYIEVIDNGENFYIENGKGMGLSLINYRANMIGGNVTIKGGKDGTILTLKIEMDNLLVSN